MLHKLKHLQSLVAVALCVIMAFAFASCSDDDDEPDSNSLAGTSWTILSDVDDADGEADEEMRGISFTLQKDGNVKFTHDTEWTYAKWSQNGNTLKIILGRGAPDEYMEGSFTINGNKATYKYSWYDYEGKWGGEDHYTMTLQRK